MTKASETSHAILTATCADAVGLVAAVAGFFAERGINIIESSHFGDPDSRRFFQRTVFESGSAHPLSALRAEFAGLARRHGMDWQIFDAARKARVLILVSRFDHCLNDLLYRYRTGSLAIEIPAIVSNHPELEGLAAWHRVPFHHLPVTASTRPAQEQAIAKLVEDLEIDLVVLARYMQVLSPGLVGKLAGRCINIHHSFLPSFKGAMPYQQAHARGVKLIGATAHYVTPDLDEGPIIEQEVQRVDHTATPEALVAIGRDIECQVLARAVRWHVERRVLLNGIKTVVLR
ncbi:MAG TPA: formyltetrahydrofolate deformylase [Candidatus Cybelea sp.]|nr:formyltetrahydrofolate deformylase [Candidatus Cybelea sp.]